LAVGETGRQLRRLFFGVKHHDGNPSASFVGREQQRLRKARHGRQCGDKFLPQTPTAVVRVFSAVVNFDERGVCHIGSLVDDAFPILPDPLVRFRRIATDDDALPAPRPINTPVPLLGCGDLP